MGPAAPGASARFRVLIDGQPPGAAHGADVDDQGNGTVSGTAALSADPAGEAHRRIGSSRSSFLVGVEAFDFTFGFGVERPCTSIRPRRGAPWQPRSSAGKSPSEGTSHEPRLFIAPPGSMASPSSTGRRPKTRRRFSCSTASVFLADVRGSLRRISDRYHLIAPDYPGFGHSDWPDPRPSRIRSITTRRVMNHFTEALGLSRYTL